MIGEKFKCTVVERSVAEDGCVSVELRFGPDFIKQAGELLYSDDADSHGIDGLLVLNGLVVALESGQVDLNDEAFTWLGFVPNLSPGVAQAFVESLVVGSLVEAEIADFSADCPDGGCDSCGCGGCVDDQGEETPPEPPPSREKRPILINVQAEPLTEGPRAYYVNVEKASPSEAMRILNYARKHLNREGIDDIFVAIWDGERDVVIEDGNVVPERLADLEHQQWAHWTRYMLDNLTPDNIERWKRQCATPYADLTEKEKASDREWARKAIAVLMGGTKSE